MLWLLAATAQPRAPTAWEQFRERQDINPSAIAGTQGLPEELAAASTAGSPHQPTTTFHTARPYNLFPRQLFVSGPSPSAADAAAATSSAPRVAASAELLVRPYASPPPLDQPLTIAAVSPNPQPFASAADHSDDMIVPGFYSMLRDHTGPAQSSAAELPVEDGAYLVAAPASRSQDSLALLSEAGTDAHEALLAILHAADARVASSAERGQAGDLSSPAALPEPTPATAAVVACRDALCGIEPQSLFAFHGTDCSLQLLPSARLASTSLQASRRILQPFAVSGTQMRRLLYVCQAIQRDAQANAALRAVGHTLAFYLKNLREKVRSDQFTPCP